MRLPLIAFINLLCLAATLAVNALANILPINGYNTGQVSAFYPNYFVPAGFTFSIWSVIYLWLLVFVGRGLQLAYTSPATSAEAVTLRQMSPWFWLTCLLNCTWILAWHYLQPGLSLLIMLGLFAVLLRLFVLLIIRPTGLSARDRYLMVVPMVIYLAWICVATIANTTALLVHFQWSGWSLSQPTWAALMIVVASLLAAWVMLRFRQGAFVLVVVWALWGIYNSQMDRSAMVGYTALGGMALCLVVLLAGWWQMMSSKTK